ncbi:hypothetical protein EV192_103703 [Actinocrispum wychmicini]|uniref:Uncharacterized protein n=1 Tax=Actinocrispum wychmicini TaxID=1213861 RepID=A0A4R2JVL5_9PSEU|nr:hypothetical protein EV192_103703 [Actinocrispum wychmicini]
MVFRDLKCEYAYLNTRSGTAWDLHFVGYECPGPLKQLPPSKAGVPLWRFRPEQFNAIRQMVQNEHRRELGTSNNPFPPTDARYYRHERETLGKDKPRLPGWRYSGRPELVSFMAYPKDYAHELIDWLSLRAVQLVDANGNYLAQSLSEVVEIMSDWRHHDSDALRGLAPGESPVVVSALPIGKALRATVSVLAAGVSGNAAYDLIKLAINN